MIDAPWVPASRKLFLSWWLFIQWGNFGVIVIFIDDDTPFTFTNFVRRSTAWVYSLSGWLRLMEVLTWFVFSDWWQFTLVLHVECLSNFFYLSSLPWSFFFTEFSHTSNNLSISRLRSRHSLKNSWSQTRRDVDRILIKVLSCGFLNGIRLGFLPSHWWESMI